MQNGLVFVEIATLAGNAPLTFMLTLADVAGLPLTQVALEVSIQLITSPFAGA